MNTRVAEGACSHLTRPLCLTMPLCFRCNADSGPSRTGKSRIIPFTFYPLSLGKKNSTVVWIRDHICGRFRVWLPGAEPSPLPLKDNNFEQNYQNDIFYSSFVNGCWRLWDVHGAPNIAGFYYINENSAMRQSLITFTSSFAYCVFFSNNPSS